MRNMPGLAGAWPRAAAGIAWQLDSVSTRVPVLGLVLAEHQRLNQREILIGDR